jgi:taurine---2-oxoglutarate transaminase
MSETDTVTARSRQVTDNDRSYVFHSWSAQAGPDLVPVETAAGCWFTDYEGKRYLDMSSQLVNLNLGHQHPALVEAVRRQAEKLCYIGPTFANDARGEAARLIVEHAPRGLSRVFFTNGGAEANENAIRMARLHTGRHKILAQYRSYHGATAGAITLTGDPRRWPNEPGIPGVVHFLGPYPYRSAFGAATAAEESTAALRHLAEVVALEGPATIAAIIIETIVGTNGILVPPDGYLAGVRSLCDAHGIMLICDEVMSGFGRTGRWFAVDHWDVAPDLITFAKGVNSGYVPLGGVLISDEVAASFDHRPYPGGLTYSGHPLACSTAVASIRVLEQDGLLDHVAALGSDVVGPALTSMAERHRAVGEVRGIGLFWAVELVSSRETRDMPDAKVMAAITRFCQDAGVWPFVHTNRIHIVPPLIISADDLRYGLAVIDKALAIADDASAG